MYVCECVYVCVCVCVCKCSSGVQECALYCTRFALTSTATTFSALTLRLQLRRHQTLQSLCWCCSWLNAASTTRGWKHWAVHIWWLQTEPNRRRTWRFAVDYTRSLAHTWGKEGKTEKERKKSNHVIEQSTAHISALVGWQDLKAAGRPLIDGSLCYKRSGI